MSKVCIGIDGGLSGAVVAITEGPRLKSWFDCPVTAVAGKSDFAVGNMVRSLRWLMSGVIGFDIIFCLEKAQPMPKDGSKQSFKTGVGSGLWLGILASTMPHPTDLNALQIVAPRTWQSALIKNIPGKNSKQRSMELCTRLFPDLPLVKPRGRKSTMDGRADAALIALYGLKRSMLWNP